jgi:hypothetical protein
MNRCDNAAMKKLLAVMAVALAAAAGIWIFARVQLANRLATVPELLPNTTLVLVEMPDPKRAQIRWRESDLNQIWREPAVQSWLEKPLGHLPEKNTGREGLEEFLSLGPTNLFVALTSLKENEPKFAGGFHFTETPERTKAFIEQRTSSWWPKSTEIKRETVTYKQHQIQVVSLSRFVFASVSYDHWFFAANDLATLKAVLDRAARQNDKGELSLRDDQVFAAAEKHLPQEFAGMVFLNPQPFVAKLLPLITMTGQTIPSRQLEALKSIRSVTAALGFAHGKMRETDFVSMPRVGQAKKLARSLLGAAGTDTLFYSSSLMQWPNEIFSPASAVGGGFSTILSQLNAAFAAHGVSVDDLPVAFGNECEAMTNWPAEAQFPTLVAALPIRDPSRARKMIDALTSLPIAGTEWTREEKNGATVFSVHPLGAQLPLSPTIVLSGNAVFLGTETAAIDSLRTHLTNPARELEKSARFRDALALVPQGDCAFNYLDTQLTWERLDKMLRPVLAVSATLYPALGKGVDLTKIPPAEVITRHLSPIVMSQRYEKSDGYATESVGPVTFRAATIGLGVAIGGSLIYLREGLTNVGLTPAGGVPGTVAGSPSPATTLIPKVNSTLSPTPSPTPVSP